MTRKFIQMGYTRARRYANHKGGKKYTVPKRKGGKQIPRLEVQDQDPDKVEAARIFKQVLDEHVWTNDKYVRLREEHMDWAIGRPALDGDSEEVSKAILSDPASQREVRKW